jgi:hypothetical protein
MSELLKSLTPFQWVVTVLGLLLILPSIRNFFGGLGKTGESKKKLRFSEDIDSVTSIVHKWEVLNNACVEYGLCDAQAKMREVFLVLVNERNVNPVPTPEGGGGDGVKQ